MRTPLVLALLLPSFFCLNAQTSSPAAAAPDGTVRTEIEGIAIPPIPNAPFTAREIVTWDEPLVGGGEISRKYYTVVARDSAGRVRRETREFVPATSTAEPPLRSFSIIDPVAGTRTKCTQATANCATATYTPRIAVAEGAGSTGTNGNLSRVSLGTQSMDSLPVVGTREVRTAYGSNRMMLNQTDLWYSPDLQMYLYVVRNNAQTGQVTLTMTDLVRGEPNASLMTVSPNFSVRGARP